MARQSEVRILLSRAKMLDASRPARLQLVFVSLLTLAFWTVSASTAVAGAGVDTDRLWPTREIQYAACDCRNGVPTSSCTQHQCLAQPSTVIAAIEDWNRTAGSILRLIPRQVGSGSAHLLFVSQVGEARKVTENDDGWCFTTAGYSGSNEPHLVVIGDDCSASKGRDGILGGVVQHEIGHAVGLYHEQQRTDRDTYIHVEFPGSTANQAIGQSGKLCAPHSTSGCQFQSFPFGRIYTVGRDLAEYDFGSIMHYKLIKPGKTMKECIEISHEDLERRKYTLACMDLRGPGRNRLQEQGLSRSNIGQRNGLSLIDIEALRELYSVPR